MLPAHIVVKKSQILNIRNYYFDITVSQMTYTEYVFIE